jgi:hypothetical protein
MDNRVYLDLMALNENNRISEVQNILDHSLFGNQFIDWYVF